MAELSNDILITCNDENRRGGVKAVYVANKTTISSFTKDVSNHEYTAVVMDSTSDLWFEIEFDEQACSLVTEGSNENGSSLQSVTVEGVIPKTEKTKALALNQLFNSCKVVAIVETYNQTSAGDNIAFVCGYDEVLGLDAALSANVNMTIEQELQGLNGYTLTLSGVQADLPLEYTGTIELNQGGTKDFEV